MRSIKDVAYLVIVQCSNYLFPLITIPIVARVFGPEKIGLLNYISAIVIYLSLVVNYSFNFTGVRRLTKEPNKRNEIFSNIFFTQVGLLLICFFIYFFLFLVIGDLRQNKLLSAITFFSCISALFNQTWFLQANRDFKFIAKVSLFSKVISFVLILLLVKKSSDIIIYALIVNFVGALISFLIFNYTIFKFKVILRIPKFEYVLNYLNEDKYLFFSAVATNLYTTTGIVILGTIGNKIDVGFYTSAQKLIDVFKNIIFTPISLVLFPLLSKEFNRGKELGLDLFKKIFPIFIYIAIASLLFLTLFSSTIVNWIYGVNFSESAPILFVLSFGLFFVFFGILIGGQIMLNLGMDRDFFKIQIIVSVISLILNYSLIPYGGGVVTAYIWTISEMIITSYQVIYLFRNDIRIFNLSSFSPLSFYKSVIYVLNSKL